MHTQLVELARHGFSLRKGLALLVLTLLGACEAKLDLAGVEQTLNASSLRTDQYLTMDAIGQRTVLFGDNGTVLLSDNDGESWRRISLAEHPSFISSSVCPDESIVALSFDKRVWRSTDNAETWSFTAVDSQEDLQTIYCSIDGSLWITASFSTLLHSTDTAKSWNEQSLNEDAMLTHVQFFDELVGVTAGEFGVFFTTSDGGDTWQAGGSIGNEFFPLDVWFRNKATGWAVGLNSVIFSTNDGGQHWRRQTVQSVAVPIYTLLGNDQQVFALGDNGTALRLRDDEWLKLDGIKTPVHFGAGRILNDGNLLVAGGWGTILKIDASQP